MTLPADPSSPARTGRANQKERTRSAILDATRELIKSGGAVNMPAVARAALVSDATAYRYFPDLLSLLREALAGILPSPVDALKPIAHVGDPVERIGYATRWLLRSVLGFEGAVRAMISASITDSQAAASRPGQRFALIDQALAPLNESFAKTDPKAFAQLKRDLAVVVSAEALFTLMDLCGLTPKAAVASAVHTAKTLTAAALKPAAEA
ncbi:MAG: hypothetical protein QOJ11_1190 [Frankiales bacterium]|jgi:AcrR family transcriptional regulator|nr:hypothetical protein [Frankiales bacterium]